MSKITMIKKSWKYEGYCMIYLQGQEKPLKRRVYVYETGKYAGKNIVYLDKIGYLVEWKDNTTTSEASQWTSIGEYRNFDKEKLPKKVNTIELKESLKGIEIPKFEVPYEQTEQIRHEQYEKIYLCVKNDIPVYLVGPAGSGKNHVLEQIAKDLGIDFYFTNSVQQEFKITGFIDAGGKYHETEFYKAFKNGGLFFLDEMDASIPEVLVLLNAAIANRYFEFPNGRITAHENFRIVSAGNTVGSGADEQYTGRLVLDQATLDRFVIIEFGYDRNVELWLTKGNVELVDFIRDLRKKSAELGVRATYSYRCLSQVHKLEGQLPLSDVLRMAVFKGLDQDTINCYKFTGSNKYHQVLAAM